MTQEIPYRYTGVAQEGVFNVGGCLKRLVAILPGGCGGTQREKMLQLRTLLDRGREGKRAVIVSVEQYYPLVGLNRRLGATKDARKLHSTLFKMGFKVELHLDLSSDEIYELFHEGRQRESIPECNVCCLDSLCHEWDGLIPGAGLTLVYIA